MKKYQNFSSENFHFLVVKFSVNLNRHVFVMELLDLNSNRKKNCHDCAQVSENLKPMETNTAFRHIEQKSR